MSLLRLVYNILRTAGAPSEASTKRDGFLSWAGETHAVSYGLTLGAALALALAGYPTLLYVVLAIYFGLGSLRFKQNKRVFSEIFDEFQYFGPSILLGFVPTGLLLVWMGAV